MAAQLETFGDIINEVLNFGFNDGPQVNRGRIERWINEGQGQIARQVDAPEFQATEELTVEQGVYKYPFATGLLRIQDIYYPEMTMRLTPVDLQQFDREAAKVVEGPPVLYTTYGSELWVYPTPNNSTDILEVRFIPRPPVLEAGTDIPVLDRDYLHLLVDYAVVRGFEAEDDPEMANVHNQRYKQDLAQYMTEQRIADRPKILDGTWGVTYGYGL